MAADKGRIDKNMQKVQDAARNAAALGSDVLMLPEYFATGYDLHKLSELATGLKTGVFAQLENIARQNSIALVGSSPSVEQGKLFNTAFYYDKHGILKNTYHKMTFVYSYA